MDIHSPYTLTPEQIAQFRRDGCIKLKQVLSPEALAHYGAEITRLTIALNTQSKPVEERSTYDRAFLQVMNLWEHSAVVAEFVMGRRLGRIAAELLEVPACACTTTRVFTRNPAAASPLRTPTSTTGRWPATAPSRRGFRCRPCPPTWARWAFTPAARAWSSVAPLSISDESEEQISANMARHGFGFDVSPFELGEVSFHLGWTFHKAGANVSRTPRAVMTVIYMDAQMRLGESLTAAQENDAVQWCPGALPGELIATPKNPVIYAAT